MRYPSKLCAPNASAVGTAVGERVCRPVSNPEMCDACSSTERALMTVTSTTSTCFDPRRCGPSDTRSTAFGHTGAIRKLVK